MFRAKRACINVLEQLIPTSKRLCCSTRFLHAHGNPCVDRGAYSTVHEDDLDVFRSILGSSRVLQHHHMEDCNRDWMNRFLGASQVALQPETSAQVSQILKHCNDRRIAVVPQAGNTGLSGGSVPVHDEVVLLTSKLNKIISFDEAVGTLVCQAGCTLGSLTKFVSDRGFSIPLDIAPKQSQAGGFISTNAGGLRFLRFGSLRGSVLGLEAVLPNGTILDLLQPVRKDNTGYDLKQLFIGGEGTLGVVTAVSLLCPAKPRAISTSSLACSSFQDLSKVLTKAKQHMGEILSAFEFFDNESLQLTVDVLPHIQPPLKFKSSPFYAIIETAGSNDKHDQEKFQEFLTAVKQEGLVSETVLASTEQETNNVWAVRKNISVALSTKGPVYKYDLSLPLQVMYELVLETRERLKGIPDAQVVAYGHLGDGNLHLNISVPSYSQAIQDRIEPFVYEFTSKHKGSISAEHGLGQMKKDYIRYSKPNDVVAVMAQLKNLFDPYHIMNPYKYLPADNGEKM